MWRERIFSGWRPSVCARERPSSERERDDRDGPDRSAVTRKRRLSFPESSVDRRACAAEPAACASLDDAVGDARGSPERQIWADIARGIGIVLVVVGHSIGGMLAAGLVEPQDALGSTFFAIYTFHMPLLFFVSGAFVVNRLNVPVFYFIKNSFRRLMRPYFIWGLVQISVIALMGRSVNNPISVNYETFLQILWHPPSQFWFLYCLFIYHALAILFYKFSNLGTMLIVASLARLLPEVMVLPPLPDMAARYWLFFSLCSYLSAKHRLNETMRSDKTPHTLLAAFCVLAATFVSGWDRNYLSIFSVPAGLAGTYAVLKISKINIMPAKAIIAYLGVISMPIFVLHVMIVAGVRIFIVSKLQIYNPYLVLLVAAPAGILLPLLFYRIANRIGAARLLGFV